jgi:hypothetical protein
VAEGLGTGFLLVAVVGSTGAVAAIVIFRWLLGPPDYQAPKVAATNS